MTFADALRAATSEASDSTLQQLAKVGLDERCEEEALALVAPFAEASGDARLWQWAGLLYRALDRHRDALECFDRASTLAPNDPGIAHGRAQVAFEAGLDAVALFERALAITSNPGPVLLGLGGARFAQGKGAQAVSDVAHVLRGNPSWIEGHRQFAQLVSLVGEGQRLTESLDRALASQPHPALTEAKLALLIGAERYADVLDTARGAAGLLEPSAILFYQALAQSELGEVDTAEGLFAALRDGDAAARVWRVRHLLRTGRAAAAVPAIDQWLASDDASAAWPYASLAWRLTGDPRSAWLDGDPQFVKTVELGDCLPPLGALLHRLHDRSGSFADQSVRSGTQTDGPLLSRVEPEIVALRSLLVKAVEGYIAGLPAADPRHPLLSCRRDRAPRFAGSWSVRLAGSGHHANHVHPQGWISSALYIALPDATDRGCDPHAGWLTLGEAQAGLGLDLPPTHLIEPRAGRLVLFPSTLWHGTRPFARGERLTIAFDVARPLAEAPLR